MSQRIGKNHARNVANRIKFYSYHIYPGIISGNIVTMRSGTRYRIGEHGEWIRINP